MKVIVPVRSLDVETVIYCQAEAQLLNLSIVFLIQRASSIVLFVFYFLHWMFCFWEMMVYYFVGVLSAVVSASPYASSLG